MKRSALLLILLVSASCDTDGHGEQPLPMEPAVGPEASFSNGNAARNPGLVTICHKPGSSAEQRLSVPEPAVAAHLLHGDGLGDCGQSPPPGAVLLTPETVSGGWAHTCGLATSGRAYCWGYNADGQLGIGTTLYSAMSTPTPAGFPLFERISVGSYHACGLTASGAAYCWGRNADGQLGDGTTTVRPAPVAVAGGLTFVQISAGSAHTCGATATGAAYCWGQNTKGQLGDGTTMQRLTPTAVAAGIGFQQISAGGLHTCALTPLSGAFCWGSNAYGQLGNGTTASSSVPVIVAGGLSFVQIEAGGSSTCGLTASRAAYCWGLNAYGQLGNGTTTNRSVPTAVSGGSTFQRISSGTHLVCGVTADATAYCWGSNAYGQLGDGTTTNRLVPTAVSGAFSFAQVNAADGSHACGVSTSGAAYCWGNNGTWQLGDGTAIQRTTPVAVAGGLIFKQ